MVSVRLQSINTVLKARKNVYSPLGSIMTTDTFSLSTWLAVVNSYPRLIDESKYYTVHRSKSKKPNNQPLIFSSIQFSFISLNVFTI